MQTIFIVEHLEPEIFEWCLIEYKHISQTVGKNNLWFTNVKTDKNKKILELYGKVFLQSVKDLKLDNVCVLDPAVQKILDASEAKLFKYFIFGGILGDYPPKKRTKAELTPLIPDAQVRNIGIEQMSTDNAVLVVSEIVKGRKFEELQFQDTIEIEINEVESVQLPYRYRIIDKKPFVSSELVDYLKKKKSF